MKSSVPPNDHNTAFRQIINSYSNAVFGIQFQDVNDLASFNKNHLYSLFLLLILFGEQEHKLAFYEKVNKFILICQKNIRECRCNIECQNCDQDYNNLEAKCHNIQMFNNQIKDIEFMINQVQKKPQNEKFNIHSSQQIQTICKALQLVLQIQQSNPTNSDKTQFIQYIKIVSSFIQINYQLKKYHSMYIIQFLYNQFQSVGQSVYLQIDRQDLKVKYIKQKKQDEQLEINQLFNNINGDKAIKENNLSFQQLLRIQSSVFTGKGHNVKRQQRDKHMQANFQILSQDKFDDEQQMMEQSLALMQPKTSNFSYKPRKSQKMQANEVTNSKFRGFTEIEESMIESAVMEYPNQEQAQNNHNISQFDSAGSKKVKKLNQIKKYSIQQDFKQNTKIKANHKQVKTNCQGEVQRKSNQINQLIKKNNKLKYVKKNREKQIELKKCDSEMILDQNQKLNETQQNNQHSVIINKIQVKQVQNQRNKTDTLQINQKQYRNNKNHEKNKKSENKYLTKSPKKIQKKQKIQNPNSIQKTNTQDIEIQIKKRKHPNLQLFQRKTITSLMHAKKHSYSTRTFKSSNDGSIKEQQNMNIGKHQEKNVIKNKKQKQQNQQIKNYFNLRVYLEKPRYSFLNNKIHDQFRIKYKNTKKNKDKTIKKEIHQF